MNRRMRWLTTLALWLLTAVAYAGTVTYVYTDPQGTPLAEANASGAITARFDYAPYGQSVTSMGAAPNGPGYTGHVNDPDTGLVYMQARYYDPEVGRFLSVDPMGVDAGDEFGFNRYAYVNNNPVVHIDPDGRQTLPPSVYTTDWRNPETRQELANLAVSVTPVVSDIQNISDAINRPTVLNVSIAIIGAVPEIGGAASKVLKESGEVAKVGASVEKAGRTIAETLPKGITKVKNAEGNVFKEVHAAPSMPHAGISPHTHTNYRNVLPDGSVRTGVGKDATEVTRKDIIDATRPNAQRTGGDL